MGGLMKTPIFFKKKTGTYSDGWGGEYRQNRDWEDVYRDRWAHDKVVRSTHGVNCTGSCSWQIFVKNGIVTWETQATDYPRTPAGVPNHEPRGCPRGASYSWYLYSAARLKHPLIRAELLAAWREARKDNSPVDAWKSMVEKPELRQLWVQARGLGGLVRVSWDEAIDIIAAANLYTIGRYGPDRICGFTPIPGYSLVSYGAGTRYLSLIGGTTLSFYDWYCDLPTSSPQTWGEQTDVPESSAWYYSSYIIVWGTNISMTRTPDAHFMNEARYNGAKVVNICPDYCETTKDADWWLHPRQSTDAALAMAMAHVILKEFHLDKPESYFTEYCRQFTDLPMLVRLDSYQKVYQSGRTLRACDLGKSDITNDEWKTVVWDGLTDALAIPKGSIGYRWHQKRTQDQGQWNLKQEDGETNKPIQPQLSLLGQEDEVADVAFPYFGGESVHDFTGNPQADTTFVAKVPAKRLHLPEGDVLVSTVFDLLAAFLGIDRGLGGQCAQSYEDNAPFTPHWQEAITGVKAGDVITLAREFATAAAKTHGRACVCIGAGVNQWYQTDNAYRAIISILMLCGTCGVPGGGWCHYVGQEKIRPEAGWAEFSFASDWVPASRQMNATSYFYEHTDQWRYERIPLDYLVSPLEPEMNSLGSYLDCNVTSELMGWLPSSPQLNVNPLHPVGKGTEETPGGEAASSSQATGEGSMTPVPEGQGEDASQQVVQGLKNHSIQMACLDPDAPENWPRNMLVWRSNILGSSGKGQEYFLKHLLGAQSGILGQELGADEQDLKPHLVKWRDAPEGKLDLLVTMDFRMSTTGLYSDIILPAATFYEKNDINTTDMHSFIHPFVKAVSCPWESKSEWEMFKLLARRLSDFAQESTLPQVYADDVVLSPLGHDTASELGQPLEVRNWYAGECDLIPGKTAPRMTVIRRDYRQIYDKLTSIGPRLAESGGGNRGITWDLSPELKELGNLNGRVASGPAKDLPLLRTDEDAANFIMRVSPETNGTLAYRSWDFVESQSGVPCRWVSQAHQGVKFTFDDLSVQPQKTFTGPDWSGTEDEDIPYVAFWQNVNLLLPWRTLTGRQQFYQDHPWMRAFGEGFPQYRCPIDQGAVDGYETLKPNGNQPILLNFMTVHQKWGIHSTYFDNERMLALSRGGPVVWMNADDADQAGIVDNDWVELWNANGAVNARAIVSRRLPQGLCIMQHATEKIVNTPGSELTGIRGGDHNSPTRITLNPTHMIGGYAQLSYHMNYYGTICPNRDDFVWLRKMDVIDWMEE